MATENNVGSVKIVGYLEKKGKLKVVTTWKKYWFVLEGRLLLYYRSQEEYDNLSPCKGSINMGLATNIRPGLATAGVFQIITRTNTITLRTKERGTQEKWLQALLDASGQQTTTNPIRMSHFRYSMDDLIPTATKQPQQQQRSVFTRQNTLPNRIKTNTKIDRNNSIIDRIRNIGGQSYGGSLDTINQIKQKGLTHLTKPETKLDTMDNKTSEKLNQDNELYNEVIVENTEYVSSRNLSTTPTSEKDFDLNKNCYIIENEQYIQSDDLLSTSHSKSAPVTPQIENDDIEYYCTYEEISGIAKPNNIYHEPNEFTARIDESRKSESDESSVNNEYKKQSKFARFTRRLKNLKPDENGLKKRSTNLINKLKGKKKSSTDHFMVEPIYDTVDYSEIKKIETQREADKNLVKTLIGLHQTLEAKKVQMQEIMEKSSSPTRDSPEVPVIPEPETISPSPEPDETHPPGLPPRQNSKSRPRSRSGSPFHDVPKNTPITATTFTPEQNNYSIDKILNDLEIQSKKSDSSNVVTPQTEELSVRQLIEKFNQTSSSSTTMGGDSEFLTQNSENIADVFLRNKDSNDLNVAHFVNRYSDDLNKLLEELTKVTSAPLLTPGVTSSLIQPKSPPMTDEEWLAYAPIRRRRHSEPDYDVPRPHRSLQILPQSPNKNSSDDNTIIPATRFFGPALTSDDNVKTSYSDPTASSSLSWRSMTPDSLEPLQIIQAAIKRQQRDTAKENSDVERDRSVGYERNSDLDLDNTSTNCSTSEVMVSFGDFKTDSYLDSLELFNNEGATAF